MIFLLRPGGQATMLTNARITKPAYAVGIVDRPRLYHRLDGWRTVRAVAIHAPAGYGKSSLVSRWLDECTPAARVAWLALDADDNDPHFFVGHLAAALDRVAPGVQALIQPILQDSHAPAARAVERLCAALQENAGAAPEPILLVLDDLHFVEAPAVHALIAACLEYGPANLHFILLARRRTALPLARLYAHGKVFALDDEDLRFTEAEVAAYLQGRGFPLPTGAEVAELTARSEGWITALQLAVLALRSRSAVHDLLTVLHGANTWLADFLTDEVLDRQPPELRHFLLQTALLDAFNAELCAAVTGMADTYGKLAAIARADLFLIPLDGKGWFRYHHLFQELLQHRLRAQAPAHIIAELHRRAAAWLARAGEISAAVRHLLAAGAAAEAAELVEADLRATLLRDPYRAQRLLARLPDDLLQQQPQLMLDRCRIAMLFDDRQIPAYLQEAGRTLQIQAAVDPHAARHRAEWLVLQAGGALVLGDLTAAADAVNAVQPQLALLDDFHTGAFQFLQMHLHKHAGHHAAMVQAAETALAAFERADWTAGVVALRRELARWSMISGESQEATQRFQAIAAGGNRDRLLVTNELIVAYYLAGENCYWLDQLAQARAYQQLCLALADQLQDQELIYLAKCLGELVDPNGTCADVDTLTGHLSHVKSRAVFEFTLECKTRSLIAAGQPEQAWQLVVASGFDPPQVALAPVRRYLVITFLRVHIARGIDLAAVTAILAETLALTRVNGDRFVELQLLALAAWQQWQLHDRAAASATWGEAARLARETGYVRVLLDIPDLAGRLAEMPVSPAADAPVAHDADGLTAQEQRVLKLLAADCTYEQVGAELVLSIGTVRTHVRHIYGKLGAHRREQAIAAARRLGWLEG
jgi:LuxR family transcriptional regulator, maltose regulon positive regulatory protein